MGAVDYVDSFVWTSYSDEKRDFECNPLAQRIERRKILAAGAHELSSSTDERVEKPFSADAQRAPSAN